jgi:hypothetical protein
LLISHGAALYTLWIIGTKRQEAFGKRDARQGNAFAHFEEPDGFPVVAEHREVLFIAGTHYQLT